MANNAPSPLTLRLMACVESFAHQEEGAIGHDDWPSLASILERELAVLQRLAQEKIAPNEKLTKRANLLRERYEALSQRINAARAKNEAELELLTETSQRVKNVRQAYGQNR